MDRRLPQSGRRLPILAEPRRATRQSPVESQRPQPRGSGEPEEGSGLASDPLCRPGGGLPRGRVPPGFLKALAGPQATALLVLVLGLNNPSWLAHSRSATAMTSDSRRGRPGLLRHLVAGICRGAEGSHYGPVGLPPAAALFSLRQPALSFNASQVLWLPLRRLLFFLGRACMARARASWPALHFTAASPASPKSIPRSAATRWPCCARLVASDFCAGGALSV